MNGFQIEMIGILNGCNETLLWLTESIKNEQGIAIDDNKSDSLVMIGNSGSVSSTNHGSKDFSVNEFESIKSNVVCLREVVCEFIATIQQNLKVLNDGIERKQVDHEMNDGVASKKSSTEEYQNID